MKFVITVVAVMAAVLLMVMFTKLVDADSNVERIRVRMTECQRQLDDQEKRMKFQSRQREIDSMRSSCRVTFREDGDYKSYQRCVDAAVLMAFGVLDGGE